MKTITIIATLLLAFISLKGENTELEKAIHSSLQQLHTAPSPEVATGAVNQLERIALAKPNQWQTHYHYAYGNVLLSFRVEAAQTKNQLLDKAETTIQTALKVDGDASELYALLAFVYQARISADGSMAMEYSQKANEYIARSLGSNQNNPRALFLKGQNLLYTPEAFGGGKGKALPYFEKSVAAFDSNTALTAIDPFWGEENARAVLQQLKDAK